MPDYKRVLPAQPRELLPSKAVLKELGLAMKERLDEPLPRGCLTASPLAGYTYFGQFIDHDLTRDKTQLLEAENKEPEEIENKRTPWLDLDHLYGNNPSLSEPWYKTNSPVQAKLFRLDPTAPGAFQPSLPGGAELDLPREGGRPQLADPRNSENLIIAQLHVLFLRFHNLAIQKLLDGSLVCPSLPNEDDSFKKARRLVTWHYQRFVREDFLPTMVGQKLLNEIRSREPKFFKVSDPSSVFMPVEFSAAAFRFGHSIVRPSYRINEWQKDPDGGPRRVPLGELLACAHEETALPHDWLVDWTRFFEGPRPHSERETARAINPQLAPDLFDLPECTIHLFTTRSTESEPSELPVRTLWRGRALRLATGQDVAKAFGEEPLGRDQLNMDWDGRPLPCGELLLKLGLIDATPLWYYILWEAERYPQCGNSLGRVGGRIVAEVIDGLVRLDPNSYLNVPPQPWKSPLWVFPNGEKGQVNSLADLLRLLGGGLPPGHPPIEPPPLRVRSRYQLRRARLRASA